MKRKTKQRRIYRQELSKFLGGRGVDGLSQRTKAGGFNTCWAKQRAGCGEVGRGSLEIVGAKRHRRRLVEHKRWVLGPSHT